MKPAPSILKLALLGVALGLAPRAAAQPMPSTAITPWPGTTVPAGTVTSMTDQQIIVRPNDPSEPIRSFGWARIQSVSGLPEDRAEAFEIGRRIWRSNLRLDRGDWTSAEALLEPLADRMRASPGPTSVEFFESLLRVRLARMDRPAAAQAWLDLRAAGDTDSAVRAELGPFYFRVSVVPEIESDGAIARVHAVALGWAIEPASGRDAQAGEADRLFETVPKADAEPRLHAACVAAYIGSDETRARARAELQPLADSDETRVGLWARYAIARSLTLDPEPTQVRLGIAGLLEVSIRDERTAPILAGLALAEAANAANRIGDPRAARVLAAEFRRRFPLHPAERTIPASLSPITSTPETSS